ncbi:MAG: hypothetical protein HY482_00175 [Candidatus Wildermuthbacteria bacterium]|nr:hypothetical protein [Candidatus Wildermuthbacteria bacterium]
MELKEFIKQALVDVAKAVDESSSASMREIYLLPTADSRTVEFDIAVSVEKENTKGGKVGIKVLEFVEGGGTLESISRNSTVTRIRFGVHVSSATKAEEESERNRMKKNRTNRLSDSPMVL